MKIEDTPLWLDIKKTMDDKTYRPIKHVVKAKLHTVKKDLDVLKVMSVDIVRDYNSKTGDFVYIEMYIPLGDYTMDIYPYRDNLELTLYHEPLLDTVYNKPDKKEKKTFERYKVIFNPDINPHVEISEINTIKYQETLNHADILTVKLELLNRNLEALRIKTTQGTFRDVKIDDTIRCLLGSESKKVKVDGKPAIDGVDIFEPDNKDKIKQMLIPSNSLITSIPTYIQVKGIGVYSSGIGTYLQKYKDKTQWFVYPLYNYKRFDKEKNDKVVFYMIPKGRYEYIERTHRVAGNIHHVLISGDKEIIDDCETSMMNDGVGFRMTDSKAIMKKPVKITKKGPEAVRNQLNYEFGLKDRQDGLNYAPNAARQGAINVFQQTTTILEKTSNTLTFSWKYGDASIFYPGMPCKYMYLKDGKTEFITGTIQGIHSFTTLSPATLSNNEYQTIIIITIAYNKDHSTKKGK